VEREELRRQREWEREQRRQWEREQREEQAYQRQQRNKWRQEHGHEDDQNQQNRQTRQGWQDQFQDDWAEYEKFWATGRIVQFAESIKEAPPPLHENLKWPSVGGEWQDFTNPPSQGPVRVYIKLAMVYKQPPLEDSDRVKFLHQQRLRYHPDRLQRWFAEYKGDKTQALESANALFVLIGDMIDELAKPN